MAGESPNCAIRFGAFELDTQAGELRKRGVRIKLQDQPFKILLALLDVPGEIVTREELTQRLWGTDTFVDFDHGLSAAVNRLREALGDSAENPRFIETLARRGYRFIAPVEGAVRPEVIAPPQRRRPITAVLAGAAAVVLIVTVAGWWFTRNRTGLPSPSVVPVTTLAGSEQHAAFSPDGKQIAFTWNGERQDNLDIYVKLIGEVTPLRLTRDPASDLFPAWSPDGRRIAFVSRRDGEGVYTVSPLGGPEQKLSDLRTRGRPCWSPDGRYLLVAKRYETPGGDSDSGAIVMIPAEPGSAISAVLKPAAGSWYWNPAFSPDGQALAFASCTGAADSQSASCTIMVAAVANGSVLSNRVETITSPSMFNYGLAWSAGGSSLVYSTASRGGAGNHVQLWRAPVRSGSKPERLDLAGGDAAWPAIDAHQHRLIYEQDSSQADIWRLDPGREPYPFLTSSARDTNPQYSPDGRFVAFESGRSGENVAEIWVANADGTEPHQLTRMGQVQSGTPRWSPDGRFIAFDSFDGKHWGVWVVEASGGTPRQVTRGAIPSWSHDGRFVYYGGIWRVRVTGGEPERVTKHRGEVAFESVDGKVLYFTGSDGIYAKRLPDGDEERISSNPVAARGLAVFRDGIFYLHGEGARRCEIRFYDFSNKRTRTIGAVEWPLAFGFAVSPDRQAFLFSRVVNPGSDLMMIENFR